MQKPHIYKQTTKHDTHLCDDDGDGVSGGKRRR